MPSVLNACELEIDLFCRGMRLPPDTSLDGARGVSRTRAGLGSGLEVTLPTGSALKPVIWTNVPVVEPFALRSPYQLLGSHASGYRIVDDRIGHAYDASLPQEPAWYSRETMRGVPMGRIGVMQGTYLGIYINHICAFWNYDPALNCRFCTTGQNVGVNEVAEKTIDDVVETCRAARDESGVTFVHLNGGFLGSKGLEYALPYVRAIKEQVGLLVGVQLAPEPRFERYDALIEAGVDHFSFCVEFLDPAWFAKICPGKARVHGQQLFFDALEYCAVRMPRGAVSGEIIAGVEPIQSTLDGIDRIASLGGFPTVCIFRPTVGSDMADWPPPAYADMRRVMRHVYDACRRHWLPIGAAPNIEVSLVVNPDDAALLADRTPSFYAYEAFRRAARVVARPLFRRRMRARAPTPAGALLRAAARQSDL
jgi:hypothetical protein